jgi:hypothetical protein
MDLTIIISPEKSIKVIRLRDEVGKICCVHGVKGKVKHMSADKYEKQGTLK